MGDTPFIKFYPSDFLGGTSGLSPAERGVYITLLCLMYENDGPVERNDARLARRCGAPKAAFVRVLEELIDQGKIIDRGGMLSNKRAEKALVDRQTRTQNATHAAHAKWSAQAQKTQRKQGQTDAGASSAQCVADAKPEARSQKPEYTISNEIDADDAASSWNDCLNILKDAGVSERSARAMIGKMCKDHGRDKVLDAISASRESVDPIAYAVAALGPSKKDAATEYQEKMMEYFNEIQRTQ